jgi:hypothetical protein
LSVDLAPIPMMILFFCSDKRMRGFSELISNSDH